MPPHHLELERLSESNTHRAILRLKGKLSLEMVHDFIQAVRSDPAEHLILDLSGCRFSIRRGRELWCSCLCTEGIRVKPLLLRR